MTKALLSEDVVARVPLEGVEAYSGARLERLELADGRRLVVKHLPAEGDWLTRVSDGLGRTRLLWDSGLLRQLEPAVDHGVVAVERCGDHDVVVMNDLSDWLSPKVDLLTPAALRAAMGALSRLHRAAEQVAQLGWVGRLGLCSVGARYGMFAPGFHAGDRSCHALPGLEVAVSGWEVFFESVDADVAAAVAAVHADPVAFGDRFVGCGGRPTVLHGDAKPENLGLRGNRLVAIDWGELTGIGPREVDVAWFALMGTRFRTEVHPSDVFAAYEQASGSCLDPDVLALACLGSVAQMGFRLAGTAYRASRPEVREIASARLAYWCDQARSGLDRVGAP